MRQRTSPLDHVTVAAPCNVGWDNMVGDERVRFCGQCSLNVYNLSGMTQGEAERLISQAEGRLCVRYYRRADGTILTKNCPVGLRALKRRLSRVAGASISAVLSFFAGVLAVTGLRERPLISSVAKAATIEVNWNMAERDFIMGDVMLSEEVRGQTAHDDDGWVEGRPPYREMVGRLKKY
jgi:hypothetical protein